MDATSKREEEHWPNLDRLSKQRKLNALAFHRALGWCIPLAILTAFLALLSAVIIYLLHILGPVSWRWLTADEIQHLHNMLFSGLIGAALAETIRKYMKAAD